MDNIDDILQNLEIPVEDSNSSQDSTSTEETNMSLSDEELNEIIEDNGVSEDEESYDEKDRKSVV